MACARASALTRTSLSAPKRREISARARASVRSLTQTSRVSESCCAIRICPARANAYGTSRAARGEGTDTLIRCTISESGGAKNVHQPKERGRANITWKRRHNRGGVILQLFVDRKKRRFSCYPLLLEWILRSAPHRFMQLSPIICCLLVHGALLVAEAGDIGRPEVLRGGCVSEPA